MLVYLKNGRLAQLPRDLNQLHSTRDSNFVSKQLHGGSGPQFRTPELGFTEPQATPCYWTPVASRRHLRSSHLPCEVLGHRHCCGHIGGQLIPDVSKILTSHFYRLFGSSMRPPACLHLAAEPPYVVVTAAAEAASVARP